MQDATSLAAAIASGRTTAAAVMEAALQRAVKVRHLDLLARLEPELGRANALIAAAGPFHGVPFLGKNLGSGAAGLTPNAGSLSMLRRSSDSHEDDALFVRFRAGGLVPFGLSEVPEFGLALTSDPARNPWNPDLTPGGSSGGAAGAVAAGLVAIAHATDAAGSIRVPAACCGLVGLKPSRGSVPGGPLYGNHLMGLASELVLARSVRDVSTAFELTQGFGDAPPTPVDFPNAPVVGLMIPESCGPQQGLATVQAARALQGIGWTLKIIPNSELLPRWTIAVVRRVLSVSLAEWFEALQIGPDEVSPLSAAFAAEGRAVSATALFATSREMLQIGQIMRETMAKVDVILSPVLRQSPPPIGHFDLQSTDVTAHLAKMEAMAPSSALANVTGLPALVLPYGQDDGGLPIGLQLMGRLGSDLALLNLGAKLQAMSPPLTFPYTIAGHP